MGKALQYETLSAGSANTEKLIGEPGLEFTVTAQFSCPPRESPTEMPGMTLSPHPGVQRVKRRDCFEASTSRVSLTPSQAVEGAAIFSNSGRRRWHWAGPPTCGKPCSNYMFLQPRNSRPSLHQGESCAVGREWEKRERKVCGVMKSA